MSYTLNETLEKLNISKYKFDKLRQYRYLNPIISRKWNGMYYIDELHISADEVDKLTPKKLEKVFLKIKKDESRDLPTKWKNKMYKSNTKFLNKVLDIEKSFDFNFESKKDVTDAIAKGISFESDKFIKLGKPLVVEENNLYRVSQIGVFTFNFWENPIFDNNELSSHLEIRMSPYQGNYIIANITVDVFEIEYKKENDWDFVYIISDMTPVHSINIECQDCHSIVKIPRGIYKYNTDKDTLCSRCYNYYIGKDEDEAYRRDLLNSNNTIILDFETASLDVCNGLVSISAIDMRGNILINTRLKPDGLIDEEASKLHGLTLDSLANEKTFSDIKDELVSIIRGKKIIFAHKFHDDFFYSFLKSYSIDYVLYVKDDLTKVVLYKSLLMNDVLLNCGLEQSPSPRHYNSLADCKFILDLISMHN